MARPGEGSHSLTFPSVPVINLPEDRHLPVSWQGMDGDARPREEARDKTREANLAELEAELTAKKKPKRLRQLRQFGFDPRQHWRRSELRRDPLCLSEVLESQRAFLLGLV
jgi:hypothetical protein